LSQTQQTRLEYAKKDQISKKNTPSDFSIKGVLAPRILNLTPLTKMSDTLFFARTNLSDEKSVKTPAPNFVKGDYSDENRKR
jgi:hypothetical protein